MNFSSRLTGLAGRAGLDNEAARVGWIERALAQIPPGSRLLDAGAGERQFRRFCSHLQYVSQDFALYDPAKDASGLHFGSWDNSGLDIVSDISSIPEPDASFDAILCTEVLEHVPYPARALEEFARLLKPGGMLVLTAPFCSLTHFAPFHFQSGFNKYFYERVLADLGFEVLEVTANGNYFEYIAQELRRLPRIAERYASSKRIRLARSGILILLRLLASLSRADTGSDELLTYGFHVRARRR